MYNVHVAADFSPVDALIKFLYYESIANLIFDFRNTTAPSNIPDLFQDISNVHFYNTRSSTSNNFYTKPTRLSVRANSFSRIGVKVWNEIPQASRPLSKNAFKRKLTQILFNILGSQDSYIDLSQIIKKCKVLVVFPCLLPTNINCICTFNILSYVGEMVFLVFLVIT